MKALASYPTYDLSTYGQDIGELSADPLKPLFNRATSELYSPGSTFKLVTAIAGLMEGIIDPSDTIFCGGSYTVEGWTMGDGRPFRAYCHQRSGHGTENLVKAIKDSCNVYFYDVGRRVGIEKLNEYAKMFGLGQHTGIETGDAEGTIAGRKRPRPTTRPGMMGPPFMPPSARRTTSSPPFRLPIILPPWSTVETGIPSTCWTRCAAMTTASCFISMSRSCSAPLASPRITWPPLRRECTRCPKTPPSPGISTICQCRVGAKTGTAEIPGRRGQRDQWACWWCSLPMTTRRSPCASSWSGGVG